jgi:hypothetical protein
MRRGFNVTVGRWLGVTRFTTPTDFNTSRLQQPWSWQILPYARQCRSLAGWSG